MATSVASTPLPLDLVTGFLGSGKTTLINAVLRDTSFAGAMVIVNEFGEVGLDHLLMASAADQVVLLDSGCLCCAVSGSLRDTLIDLFSRRQSGSVPAFDRLIVETSGLANPAPLIASLLGDSALTPRCRLAQVLTLVDAVHGGDSLERYQEARRQVALADQLLVTKVDLVSSMQLEDLEGLLATFNGQAPIAHRSPVDAAIDHFAAKVDQAAPLHQQDDATARLARWRRPARPQYGEPGHALHGDNYGRITARVLHVPREIDWAGYAAWSADVRRRFGKRLLRCKGLVWVHGDARPWVVQGVQGYFAAPVRLAADLSFRAHDSGYLVCIGEGLDPDELDRTLPLLGDSMIDERNA